MTALTAGEAVVVKKLEEERDALPLTFTAAPERERLQARIDAVWGVANRRARKAAQATTAHGSICHAGGRTLEITSKHLEWTDWATRALDIHDDLVRCLDAIVGSMPGADTPEFREARKVLKRGVS